MILLLQTLKPYSTTPRVDDGGANHGGLWRVAYLARTALPFVAIYGFAAEKLPFRKFSKNNNVESPILELGFLCN